MIDFKNEIIKKQEEKNRGIDEYNKVIDENFNIIEELFKFKGSTFKVSTKNEEDHSTTLNIREVGEDGIDFKYSKISKLIIINKDLIEIRNIIESELKEFVVDIIIKNNINIVNEDEDIKLPKYMGTFKEKKNIGKNKLDFNERIGYNFGIKELNKKEYEKLIKDNSDKIKEIFKPFKEVIVDIKEFGITISDNFGIIGELNINNELNKKENPSEILLNFVADTYLKIDCWERQ